ncbi:carboxy-S-adenosyl-L-methionine synthase CmoA [Roseibacillus ishigakijimensis]|uniref:Carboxy-S-adenosyl-L-methionine synthase n=1 Tax=Roseibacillus ishigakijimensis TaxID=454146 RepID=A0A934RLN7_9BACT|nr:carboxy-S-adenosyl-L-methionine synthase CmoA [Roseibacillus ishigakijimensis]MBK1834037.1 carboxy-S-adenosyl-L-methionine synthase CmoA [Roseibacillus ishigakijimensis]
MSRDQIYARNEPEGRFEFSEKVVTVFEDMIRRSVPGYGLTLTAIEAIAGREVPPGTRIYDLGCSLGAGVEAAWQGARDRAGEIHGVDSSPAMVKRARELLDLPGVAFHQGDATTWPLEKAGLIILNFTLQFIPLDERAGLLQRCHEALVPGGVLFLSEKFVSSDPAAEDWLRELHWQFKRQQGYSELEIARKRDSLEDVLLPETPEVHLARLRAAGFQPVTQVLQCLNFASWVGRKQ